MATFVKYEGKRGTSWMVRVRKHGKSFTETFPTKKLGQEWATKMEHAIIEETHFPERRVPTYHTVGEAITIYNERMLPHLAPKTQKAHAAVLRWWHKNIGDTGIQHVTPALLEDYKYTLLRRPLKPSTVNFYLNCLSPVFSYAASDSLKWIPSNPVPKVKRFRLEDRVPVVSDSQIAELLMACEWYGKPYLSLFVRLALATGGRSGEILHAQWKQVNFKRATMTFVKTKTRKDRTVPLDTETLAMLRDYYERQFPQDEDTPYWDYSEAYIFVNPKTGKPLGHPAIHRTFKRACAKANLDLHRHDLRHIFCSKMVEKTGADIATLAELLGHSTLKMVMKYRHIGNHQYAPQVQKMAEQVFPKRGE
jgi:integrase